jgi:anthranilate phosphoribosyltransferase
MLQTKQPQGALPYMMTKILNRLRVYDTLSYEEAKEVLYGITGGLVNESQITAFITVFMMRRATPQELAGFRDALLEQCLLLTLPGSENAIDIVGTGGDGKNTFNISTLAAFVVAGAGYKVIKHGNHGATSISGSSDVLQYLGYRFHSDKDSLSRQLEQSGICFLHAPLFHPVMKKMGPVRRDLGVRTFFNLLGPLINPARPGHLLLGANTAAIARMYHYLLQESDCRYKVVHSLCGYDEVSLTGAVQVYGRDTVRLMTPAEFGLGQVLPEQLDCGNSIADAAAVFLEVLENRSAAEKENVVLANSALAIQCMNEDLSFEDSLLQARESLKSGKAYQSFKKSVQTT